jgi:hypothetical protein
MGKGEGTKSRGEATTQDLRNTVSDVSQIRTLDGWGDTVEMNHYATNLESCLMKAKLTCCHYILETTCCFSPLCRVRNCRRCEWE